MAVRQTVVSYSAKSYQDVLAQIDANADLRDTPAWYKRMLAGVLDVINNSINAIANTMFARTVFSRPQAVDMFRLIDYQMSWKQEASVDVTVTVDSSATSGGPYTISVGDLIAQKDGTSSDTPVRFEARAALTIPMSSTTGSVTMYNQTTRAQKSIGTTGGTSWERFDMGDTDVLPDTVEVSINGFDYTKVEDFASSSATDKVWRFIQLSNGDSQIQLGGIDDVSSDQFGFIPSSGYQVLVTYAVGGGLRGNVSSGTITTYLGTDSNVTAVTNASAATGGKEEESIANAREVAPLNFRRQSFFINRSSGIALAESVAGVSKAEIVYAGLLSVACYIIPNGGGLPSAGLKTSVQELLVDRSPLEQITVTVDDPIYVPQSISVQVKMLSGYDFADVEKYIKFAIAYRSHEAAEEIAEAYQADGLTEDTFSTINSILGTITGETYSESDEASQLTRILENVPTQEFSESFRPADIIAACAFVNGIDYVDVLNPGSVLSINNGQILQPTSIAVAEI